MSSSPTSTTIEVVMPQMGVSVAEGTVAAWLKSAGEEIAAEETVCEVTTDKIDVEIPAPAAGVLTRILVEEGETVGVGTVLGEIGSEDPANAERPGVGPMATNAGRSADEATGSVPGRSADEATGSVPGRSADETAGSVPGRSADETAGSVPDRSGFHSPIVRRIAAEHGIDLDTVEGTGVGGRIRKHDLLELIAAPADRPLHTESPYREEPATRSPGPASIDELVGPTSREQLSPMRRAIASHMLASRSTSAHCTTIVEADFSAAAARRAELEGRRDRPTYLAFVARAVVEALERYPVLNASIEGDELVMHEDVNLGIAVALDDGLIVPVIRRAQRLSLEGMAAAIADVAARARAGELAPDDTHGGTFTITNPGQFGALLATPIINQPQVGILDVEAVVQRPVAIEDGAGGHAVAVRPMGYLCMSWDHRALDGAVAARFLADVRARVEEVRS